MNGLHLTADLYDCRSSAALMTDADRLGLLCRTETERVGLTLVHVWVVGISASLLRDRSRATAR